MTLFALALVSVGVGISAWKVMRSTGGGALPTPLKLAPLALVAFGLQLTALHWADGIERTGLFSLSQGMLLTFFAANFKCKPLRLLAIGFLLNLLPIAFNHGYMPITPAAMTRLHPGTDAAQWTQGFVRPGSKDIVAVAAETPFWFLGDVLVVSQPFPLPTAFSLGDLVILIGFGWTVYHFTPSIGAQHVAAH
jgi:Family of unknown function (DUF5317)